MNRRQKRMENLREAKDKKMKKVAAGLTVVLAIVLAFEVPSLLKGSGGGSSTPPAATTTDSSTSATPPTTVVPATTPPGTAAAAVTPVTSSQLPNSNTLPKVGKSQLYSFSHFAAKDPFVQQVVDATQGLPDQSGQDASGQPTQTGTGTDAAIKRRQQPSTRTLAVRGAARIAVNGRVQVVRAGTSFPSSNPLFRLVSVNNNGVARIGIASGSYSSGARTISLVPGRTLTLVDTADGIRYQLRLLG
jgi:hypothetical protein